MRLRGGTGDLSGFATVLVLSWPDMRLIARCSTLLHYRPREGNVVRLVRIRRFELSRPA
jgi:hypothetical protein